MISDEDVLNVIRDLLEGRAKRGNPQSKHGLEAAEGYELQALKEALNRAIESR